MSAHFKQIWELSIEIRNHNFDAIDSVIDKSGLIELLMELRKSSRIVFIALVHRLVYVRWFAEKFTYLTAETVETPDRTIEKFEMVTSYEIPAVDYAIAVKGVCEKLADGDAMSFEGLVQSLRVHTRRVADEIAFKTDQACADLEIPPFDGDFGDTVKYADSFFTHLERELVGELLKHEARSSHAIFTQFTTLCRQKELEMVREVFGLRDTLKKFAYSKCTHEMEVFSERFRAVKRGETIAGEPFEFDVKSVNERIRPLAESLVLLGTPVVIQSIVSFEAVLALANELCESGKKYTSDEEFLAVAKSLHLNEIEIEQIELCMRVLECVECFDVQKFLGSFPKTREEDAALERAFTRKRIINPLVAVGRRASTSGPVEEEEYESPNVVES
jgi:hypothetical protein